MREAKEILRIAKELLALGDSREESVVMYLYGHVGATPFEMSRDLSLEIDEAKAIHDLWAVSEHELRGNLNTDRKFMDQIRKILAKGGSSQNPLDGMSNEKARKEVYKIMAQFTKGVFKDDSWVPIHNIWEAFNAAGLDWTMMGSQYLHNSEGRPSGKEWKFEIKFLNKNGRLTTMHGTVTASGAGSVEDPLDRYDLVGLVY